MTRRAKAAIALLSFALGIAAAAPAADARSSGAAWAAFARGDYVKAATLLTPMAQHGHARAMTVLGYMYENGLGVPQSYEMAVDLYARAAEHGDPTAQHLFGLAYDKGHGVPTDPVLAYKWLSLAAGAASARERGPYLRIRDAVASKMSSDQIVDGQRLAVQWQQGLRGQTIVDGQHGDLSVF
ncbi:tetratricopeptide repeat protein [Bradyrhizobium sp. HKCCYLS2038]|uniref:tetratricopeptide repeat protein n=1 Tax=unclassified Bradyrhizobium TaxID=2631580 RepID=UPI003EBC5E4B